MNLTTLIDLLARALDESRCTPPERTLVVHLAERGGVLVAAAVFDELRISPEFAA